MSSATIKTVAIAGATGSLGAPITQALLDAGFTITALVRPDSTSPLPPGVKAATIDYTSPESLTAALTGQDALVSCLGPAGSKHQAALLRAAVAAGVSRILPSEFGSDPFNPRAHALPVYAPKVADAALLEQLCADSAGKSTYTYVLNGVFLDWGIARSFLIDVKNKTYELIDGGDRPFSGTPLPFIGAGVAAILQRPEQTANRAIRLQGARMTQRELLALVQRAVGGSEGWTITEANGKEIEEGAYAALEREPGNPGAWAFPMLKLAVHVDGFGGDFGENNDNEMLGLKMMDEKEIEEMVRKSI